MRDFVTLGPTPANEECVSVGSDDYSDRVWKETYTFVRQIRREIGPEVGSAELRVKAFPHDFGTYHEVVCYYDPEDEEGMRYAYRCENESPETWDDEARRELGLVDNDANLIENWVNGNRTDVVDALMTQPQSVIIPQLLKFVQSPQIGEEDVAVLTRLLEARND